MELTTETRLAMIEAGHRRWQKREQEKLAALFAGTTRRGRRARDEEEDEGDELSALFDEVSL